MEVSNVKFHYILHRSQSLIFFHALKKSELVVKKYPSFCVLRLGRFVYVCFYSGCINITGVKNIEHLYLPISCLCFSVNVSESMFINPIVDNVSAKFTGDRIRLINLITFAANIKDLPFVKRVKYNRERFPCMFVRTLHGTIIWSPRNAITCVGIRGEVGLLVMEDYINTLLKKL